MSSAKGPVLVFLGAKPTSAEARQADLLSWLVHAGLPHVALRHIDIVAHRDWDAQSGQ